MFHVPRFMFHAILKTLAYFDVFDYPLTAVEVHKFLWGQTSTLSEVVQALEQMENAGQIGRRFGYYCLPGREVLVETRWQRYLLAESKFSKALRVARLLRLVPNVRLMAVCNNLAFSNARKESDIDLLIVTSPGRIWISRLLVTVLVQLLGLRRHGKKIADRCCLSFYVTADAADVKPLALAPEDPYLCYWLAMLAIVYVRPGAADAFWQANAWVRDVMPNFRPRVMNQRRTVRSLSRAMWSWRAGEWLNGVAKKIQLAKMARRERHRQRGIGVVISDRMLKFHEDDRRTYYRKQWQERIERFLPLAKGEIEGVDAENIRGG